MGTEIEQVTRESLHRTNCRTIWSRFAADAIGPVTKGCEIFGVCKGQFSLVELIDHCLEATGPADVVVSTWTAGGADILHFGQILEDARIRKCYWLLDFSFASRQPEYADLLIERFGADSCTFTANHAKFVLLGNSEWKLAIRTSMNLNRNRRLETYEISDSPALFSFLQGLVKSAFAEGRNYEQVCEAPDEAACTVDLIGGETEKPPVPIAYGKAHRNIRYGSAPAKKVASLFD